MNDFVRSGPIMGKHLLMGFLFCSLLTAEPKPACAQPGVVVPNALTAVEGSLWNCIPFGTCNFQAPQRYQQVYAVEEIGGSGVIDKIVFRPDIERGLAFIAAGVSVDIRLSHTTKSVDGLSANFAENVGPDEKVVLDTNNLTYFSNKTNCGEIGPCDFDIMFDVNDIFIFNGVDNLLLDVRLYVPIPVVVDAGSFDAQNLPGDSVSRVRASNVESETGFPDTGGLVTKFIFKEYEPSEIGVEEVPALEERFSLMLILLVGLTGVYFVGKRV